MVTMPFLFSNIPTNIKTTLPFKLWAVLKPELMPGLNFSVLTPDIGNITVGKFEGIYSSKTPCAFFTPQTAPELKEMFFLISFSETYNLSPLKRFL